MTPVAKPLRVGIAGLGTVGALAIVAFATFWPILILTKAAIAGIEPRLLEVSRALGFSLLQRVWKSVLPAALPRIFVAFRLAAGIALIVAGVLGAGAVITDSGGLQEETTYLGIPCFTLRENTERPVTITPWFLRNRIGLSPKARAMRSPSSSDSAKPP